MTDNINKSEGESSSPFPGKIAVITGAASMAKEDFHSVKHLNLKYGTEKIVHVTWPENFVAESSKMIDTAAKLAADREIKILIINQAVPGTNPAVDKLKETRDDIFIVYCTVHDSPSAAAVRADMLIMSDEVGMGPAILNQAKKQGARTFVHYSFPRHMSRLVMSGRRDLIRQACAAEGIQFIEATAPDPMELGTDAAQQFMLEDVPKMAAKYGEDTAFFCTNCHLQVPLIKAVVDSHTIYPQPCCPSPYHGFPEALSIDTGEDLPDLTWLISEACRIAAEKNMTDRLSTWPVSTSMMYTNAAAEYAIKRINGEVPETSIDSHVLKDCMNAYITDVVGEESNVYMKSYSENNIVYDNFKLILMSYLDF